MQLNLEFQPVTGPIDTPLTWIMAIGKDDVGLTLWGGFIHQGRMAEDYGLLAEDGAGQSQGEGDEIIAWAAYPDRPTYVHFEELSEVSKLAFKPEASTDDGQWIDLRADGVAVMAQDRQYFGLLRTSDGIMIVEVFQREGSPGRPEAGPTITADTTASILDKETHLIAIHPLPRAEELEDLAEGSRRVIH